MINIIKILKNEKKINFFKIIIVVYCTKPLFLIFTFCENKR